MKSVQTHWCLAALGTGCQIHCSGDTQAVHFLCRLSLGVCNHTTRLTGDWLIKLNCVNPTFNEVKPNHHALLMFWTVFPLIICLLIELRKLSIVQTPISPTFSKTLLNQLPIQTCIASRFGTAASAPSTRKPRLDSNEEDAPASAPAAALAAAPAAAPAAPAPAAAAAAVPFAPPTVAAKASSGAEGKVGVLGSSGIYTDTMWLCSVLLTSFCWCQSLSAWDMIQWQLSHKNETDKV